MIARPSDVASAEPGARATADSFVRSVLTIAAEVEQAENAIKDAILEAARAGDCAAVIDIVTRWKTRPATQVLARDGHMQKPGRSSSTGLD